MKSSAALRKLPIVLKKFKQHPNNSKSGNVTAGWVRGDKVSVADYHYCHASVNKDYHIGSIPEPDAIISQIQKPATDENIMRRYFEWLFNYSPFRNVFISKNAAKAMDRKVIIASVDQPSNLVGGALIATRLGNERYQTGDNCSARIYIWNRLVELGVHPSLAFTIACASLPISIVGGPLSVEGLETLIFDPINGVNGHVSLSPTSLIPYVLGSDGSHKLNRGDGSATHNNFFHEKMPGANKETFRIFQKQYGSSYLWLGDNPTTKFNVNKAIKQSLEKEFSVKIPAKTNPFAAAKVDRYAVASNGLIVDFNPAMEVIAKVAKEIVKEI